MNRWLKAWGVVGLTVGSLLAAPLVDEPVPALKLKDGTVLREVQAKGFMNKVVLVKCADGVRTVPYELFPDEYRTVLAAKRQGALNEALAAKAKLAAQARDQAMLKAQQPAPAPSVAPAPELHNGCRVALTGSRGALAFLRIENVADRAVAVSPAQFAARTFAGEMYVGTHWVQLDDQGRVTETLKSQQSVGAKSFVTLALATAIPPDVPDNTIAAVVWR
jgi:hypothetical protein